MPWTKHHANGFTSFQTKVNGCKLRLAPLTWTSPKGPTTWHTQCGSFHKTGRAKTRAAAQSAARRAARRRKRR